jgi:hypothetical protein
VSLTIPAGRPRCRRECVAPRRVLARMARSTRDPSGARSLRLRGWCTGRRRSGRGPAGRPRRRRSAPAIRPGRPEPSPSGDRRVGPTLDDHALTMIRAPRRPASALGVDGYQFRQRSRHRHRSAPRRACAGREALTWRRQAGETADHLRSDRYTGWPVTRSGHPAPTPQGTTLHRRRRGRHGSPSAQSGLLPWRRTGQRSKRPVCGSLTRYARAFDPAGSAGVPLEVRTTGRR